jgi:hypothetical protein
MGTDDSVSSIVGNELAEDSVLTRDEFTSTVIVFYKDRNCGGTRGLAQSRRRQEASKIKAPADRRRQHGMERLRG